MYQLASEHKSTRVSELTWFPKHAVDLTTIDPAVEGKLSTSFHRACLRLSVRIQKVHTQERTATSWS